MSCGIFSAIWRPLADLFRGGEKKKTDPETESQAPALEARARDGQQTTVPGQTVDAQEQEWTIDNTKLLDFNPPGLEVDDEKLEADIINPYITNPIERDESVAEENRSWHQYKYGTKYFLPNDNAELSRLDRQHILWRQILDGELFKAPAKEAKQVLDMGTGSGVWAVEFAKEHPDSTVLGVDLSKPTRPDVPINCEFQQRDFMDPWDYPHKFDYIHGRLIFVAQSDPRRLLQLAYDSLAPGGILEFHELYPLPHALDSSLKGRWLDEFFFNTAVASKNLGNDILCLPQFKTWMSELGFEDVVEEHGALPVNTWPKGKYKTLGAMQNENLKAGLSGIYTRMMMNGLDWSAEKTADAIEKALEDVNDLSLHAFYPVFIVYGRKPLAAKN